MRGDRRASNRALAQRLAIAEASVVKRGGSIFTKLEREPAEGNRRVLTVLARLLSYHEDPPEPVWRTGYAVRSGATALRRSRDGYERRRD